MTNNNARCTDFMKRLLFHIPHQSVSAWRTRRAAGARHSASLRSLELTRSISLSVGGLDLHLRRASDTIVDATERDPRLPLRVTGGRDAVRRGRTAGSWRTTDGVDGGLSISGDHLVQQ